MLVPKPKHKRRIPTQSKRGEFSKKAREEILERDDGICQQCKNKAGEEVHHVKFKSQGGRGVASNGVSLCHNCHTICHRTASMAEYWQYEFEQRYGLDYYKDQWDV